MIGLLERERCGRAGSPPSSWERAGLRHCRCACPGSRRAAAQWLRSGRSRRACFPAQRGTGGPGVLEHAPFSYMPLCSRPLEYLKTHVRLTRSMSCCTAHRTDAQAFVGRASSRPLRQAVGQYRAWPAGHGRPRDGSRQANHRTDRLCRWWIPHSSAESNRR
jgi:hypothetical protein